MSTSSVPIAAGQQPPVAAGLQPQPDARCECDHLLSQHSTGGELRPCREQVLDRESSFRHRCRCSDFFEADHLSDALAILAGKTLKMPQLRHLEALHTQVTRLREDLAGLKEQAAADAFLQRVAVQLYGKFDVMCEGCDRVREFRTFEPQEAADVLRDEGWELEKKAEGGWRLLCPKCFLT